MVTSPVDPVSEEGPIFKASKKRKRRNESNPRKSSRSLVNKSYNENSPEVEENSIDEELLKVEVRENSRVSSSDLSSTFGNITHHDSSDFSSSKANSIKSENKKPKMPEIFTTCNICPKVKKVRLQDLDDLKIHNEYVHEDLQNPFLGPFKCKTCSKVITSEVKMRKHVRLFHVFGNEKLCGTCGKKFYDRRAFYCHVDKNHGIRVRKNIAVPNFKL